MKPRVYEYVDLRLREHDIARLVNGFTATVSKNGIKYAIKKAEDRRVVEIKRLEQRLRELKGGVVRSVLETTPNKIKRPYNKHNTKFWRNRSKEMRTVAMERFHKVVAEKKENTDGKV